MIGLVVPTHLSFLCRIFKQGHDVPFWDLFDLSLDAQLSFSKSLAVVKLERLNIREEPGFHQLYHPEYRLFLCCGETQPYEELSIVRPFAIDKQDVP
jgi:hypothetical protein